MAAAQPYLIYDELLDFLVEKASPQELMAFRPSSAAQQRADELTEKNKAGTLSAQERAELEQMLALDRFVTALKARAAKALKQT
ncbi:MAG: hypothetical protein CL610_23185 [Anaerolineaceae bacterium]|nr:hypothetical protein [Anaerolineaceae bacterium]